MAEKVRPIEKFLELCFYYANFIEESLVTNYLTH